MSPFQEERCLRCISRLRKSFLHCTLTFLALSQIHSAYAIDASNTDDHNHHRLSAHEGPQVQLEDHDLGVDAVMAHMYEPAFDGLRLDRGVFGRAAPDITPLKNNVAGKLDIAPGNTQSWVIVKDEIFAPRPTNSPGGNEDGRRKIFISLTVCSQPSWNNSRVSAVAPPALRMMISTSSDNQRPGPASPGSEELEAIEGYASIALNVSSDVFIGVSAVNTTSNFNGGFSYEIAASNDAFYHELNQIDPNLFLVDSDFDSALFITHDTNVSDGPAPFVLFAHQENDTSLDGLRSSYCALRDHAPLGQDRNNSLHTSFTDRTYLADTGRKLQFYLTGLKHSSTYNGILARPSANKGEKPTKASGGSVWKSMTFTTKKEDNCKIIFDLPFCSSVAWAVPANPTNSTTFPNLTLLYDENAKSYMQNFSNALALTACETSATGQYSLAVNCSTCADVYKDWLCSVAIPRCADYSSTDPWLQARNILSKFTDGRPAPAIIDQEMRDNAMSTYANQSRMPWIDTTISPGPYKEILPCEGLCHALVRNCPATLQFVCPLPEKGLWRSYGRESDQRLLTCNRPGLAYNLNDATGTSTACRFWQMSGLVLAVVVLGSRF